MGQYADLFAPPAEDQKARAALNLRFGIAAQPDAAAQEQALARRYGLPTEAVRLNLPEFKARAAVDDAAPLLDASPKLRGWLAERPDRAMVAHPDIGALSQMAMVARNYGGALAEGVVGQGAGFILSGVGRTYDIAARGLAAPLRAAGLGGIVDAPIPSWADPARVFKRPGEALQALGRDMGPDAANRSFGTDVASGLGQIGGQIGIQLATGGLASLATLFAQGVESMGQKVDDDPSSQARKDVATLGGGAITALTEKYALDKILGPLAVPVKNAIAAAVARIGVAAATEGVQESVENIAQDALRKLLTNKDAEIDLLGSAYEGGVGATVGGIARGVVEAAFHVKHRGRRRDHSAALAAQHAQFFSDLAKTAEAIPLRERSPEDFQTFAQSLLDDDVPALHFDAQVLMQAGVTAAELATVSETAAAALDEAAATGGSVSIPTGEFLARAPGSAALATLVDHARTDPDAMSAVEGRAWMAERGDAMQAEMADALAEKQGDQGFKDSQEAVKQTVLGELNAVGRASTTVNEAYATLVAARTAVRAAQLGMTPEAMFERQRLRVRGDAGADGQALEQGSTRDAIAKAKETIRGALGQLKANKRNTASYTLMPVAPAAVAEAAAHGLDVAGFAHAIDGSAIRHTFKNHGDAKREAARGQIAITDADLELIPDIVSAPDKTVYGLQNDIGRDMIVYLKTIPDGTTVYLEEVRTGAKTLTTQSMRRYPRTTAAASVVEALRPTSETLPGDAFSVVERPVPRNGSDEFNQSASQGARGTFHPATNTIRLLSGGKDQSKSANLSTFLHEAGHYFFENDIALAAEIVRSQREGASVTSGEQALLDDVSALMRWHGFTGNIDEQLREWYSLSFDQQRQHHERTAESFERYLFSGKAPSLELQRPFQQFRSWLINVYKSLKDFLTKHPEAGTFSDEVRGVFDRMLATTEAIQEAEAARSMGPLFQAADGVAMDAQQWADYNDLGLSATREGIELLQARGLRDMKWLHNAQGKALRELQAQAKAAREQVRMDVRAEVLSRPIYRAWQFLTAKAAGPDEQAPALEKQRQSRSVDAAQDSLLTAIANLGGINRDSALRDLSIHSNHNPASGVFGMAVFPKTGGMMADDMREALTELGYLREFDEHGRTELRELDELVAAELGGDPQYSFQKDYTDRDGAPAEPLPEHALAGKLSTATLREWYGSAEDAAWRKLSARRMTSDKVGVHPDVVAETFGLESGDAMVRELADVTPPAEVIEALTDERMLEQHADLATPEALQEAANAAVHTRLRERLLATELAALQRATSVREGKPGQRNTADVLAAAARDYAQRMVAGMKAGDLSPARFEAAAARAGREAAKAFKAGDVAVAAAAKRNQLIQAAAARAVREARDETHNALRYFRRFDTPSKGLDAGYREQISALLDKFSLRGSARQDARTTSLRNWVLLRLADGEVPPIAETLLSPSELAAYRAEVQQRDADGDLVNDDEKALELLAGAIDRSAQRAWRDVTVEELRGLRDTVRSIEHHGRRKRKLLSNREQASYETARDEMEAAVRAHGGAADKNTPTRTDKLGRALAGIKHFGAAHIKAATWARIMDGMDGGPLWRYMVRPANEAASLQTTMRAEATAALDAIMRPVLAKVPVLDKVGQGKFYPSLGRSLNWQERFAIALNMGNESNLQRLLDGSGWTMPQIMPVIRSLSAQEWRAVQAVWDHLESYRPLIAEKEKRVNGREPDWIQPRALQVSTADGQSLTLRGGYYPVRFDPRVNLKAGQHSAAEEARDLLKGAYGAATTRRSFVKTRVAEVKGRPLLLSLDVLYTGVSEVIHDLAWHEWVLDANKLLRSKTLDAAIREHYGPEVKRELERWRDDIVAGSAKLHHGIERAAGWARQSVTAAALTFNVVTAAMQPLGIANSWARVGTQWIGKGVARYVAAPIESTREAQGKSEWLRNRTRTRFRELNELRNQVQGQTAAKELMGRYGYWLMMRTQLMVDVPTWWAGYERAIAGGHDETTAVAMADQVVKDSQGGGEEVDQSGIERGPALVKLFTAFYGFMGTTANVTYLTGKTEASKGRAAAKIALVLMVPAVLGMLLKDALVPGDDDDEGLMKKLVAEQISFLFGLVAFGREFAQVGKTLLGEDKGLGYSGPAGLRLIPDTVKLAQQARQGEFDEAFRKAFVSVLGDLTGIPAVQVNRTWTGVKAVADGKTEGPVEAVAAPVLGFRENR